MFWTRSQREVYIFPLDDVYNVAKTDQVCRNNEVQSLSHACAGA